MLVPNSIPRPVVRVNQWFIVVSVLAAWITGWTWILALPLVAGLAGLLLKFNPVMRLAKLFLRKSPDSYIPEDKDQQRFNQWIAVTCLAISLASFVLHLAIIGYVFSALVLTAAFIAICGFCVGCFIQFQLLRLRNRKHRLPNRT